LKLKPPDRFGPDRSGLPRETRMFLMIAGILVVCWLLGFVVFHVSSFLIHILLLLAIVSLIWNFVSGRRAP
jgi:Flp pilus assembly protein TadB